MSLTPPTPSRIALAALAVAALLAAPATAGEPDTADGPPAWELVAAAEAVDHVGLAVADLERGIEAFAAAAGVHPEIGGRHPHLGTWNALLSLDEGRYLEIIAPDPGAESSSPLAGELTGYAELTPVLWAVASDDVAGLQARLEERGAATGGVVPGSRRKPDGTLLEWKTLGVTGPADPLLPFFIEWSAATRHPSADAPGGCSLASLRLVAPDPAATAEHLELLGLAAEVVAGEPPRLTFELDCPGGRLRF